MLTQEASEGSCTKLTQKVDNRNVHSSKGKIELDHSPPLQHAYKIKFRKYKTIIKGEGNIGVQLPTYTT